MFKRHRQKQAASRRAIDKPKLDQKRLDNIFQSIARLAQCGGHCVNTNRPAHEFFGHHLQIAVVERVQPAAVNIKTFERAVGEFRINAGRLFKARKIAHAPQ